MRLRVAMALVVTALSACGGEEFTATSDGGSPGGGVGGTAASGGTGAGGGSGGTGAIGGSGGAGGSGGTGVSGGSGGVAGAGGAAGASGCGAFCAPPAKCIAPGVCEIATGSGAEYPSLGPSRVYWSNSTALASALRDGSDHPGSEILAGGAGCEGTAVSSTSVFLAVRDTNEIKSSGLAGESPATLVSGASGPQELAADGTHLYWTDRYSGSVKRIALAAGAPETITQNLTEPRAIAVDGSNVFFSAGEGLYRCTKGTGCTATQLVSSGATLPSAWSNSTLVALDASRVYWLLSTGVASVPKSGGSVVEHATGPESVEGLSVAGGYVHWGTSGTPSVIRRRPVDNSGPVQDLVTSEGSVRGLIVDASSGELFYIVQTDSTTGACSIRKIQLPS